MQDHQGHQQRPGEEEPLVELEEGGDSAAQARSRGWLAIFTSCFSHRFATTSRSPTCGGPSSPAASLTEEEVSSILAMSPRPWRSFWTRHGGARGRRRRGKPWVSGEEHQEGGVQSCSPSTWWTSTRESESESESEMDSSSDLAAGVNCQSVFVS